ncbi:plasmid replication initiator TrfA [Ralstonia solanacearum]|uniref:plasmid replication initiator TrfA n=1 Tax=Ralstonia solanacearum TaxID=305 RepID=UPI000F614D3F|nr:plasmid replication initiator TrfA [Ralstonia solanacearum]
MSSPLFTRFPTLAARAAEAQSRIEAQREAIAPQQLFLPGLEDFMRAMPNHIARSSLFAPVARGRKRIHKDMILVSRADAVIKFWGEQLDESQADVWMQAMHEASRGPLGEPVVIKRAKFLRDIGRQTGNYEYKWLNRTMQTLTFAMLVIEVRAKDGKPKLSVGKNRALHMIEGFDYDDEAEAYTLRIDPRWRVMFGNREFALIDWEKRKRFGARQDMAKALQRLSFTLPPPADKDAANALMKERNKNFLARLPLHFTTGSKAKVTTYMETKTAEAEPCPICGTGILRPKEGRQGLFWYCTNWNASPKCEATFPDAGGRPQLPVGDSSDGQAASSINQES